MIAYFILVHRYPDQFKRMFKSIYLPGNQYVVHADKSSGKDFIHDIRAFIKPYQGAEVIEPRKALWGGYSLVEAELRGMERLLAMDNSWSHYINLSGQDFPLKSQAYIRDFLQANAGKQFMRAVDQNQSRSDTLNRIDHFFIEILGRMIRAPLRRRYLTGATPFIGTQWKAVTRRFCEFVCHDPKAKRFKHFYRHSFIADESFFQSVLMNTGNHGQMMNDDLRMIDWVPDGDIKLRPRNFEAADAARLMQSPDLFARKFDAQEDSKILDLLEAHLTTPAAMIFRPMMEALKRPFGNTHDLAGTTSREAITDPLTA